MLENKSKCRFVDNKMALISFTKETIYEWDPQLLLAWGKCWPITDEVHFTDQVDANPAGTGSNDPLAKGIESFWVL